MRSLIHVTHEACEKIGGIGAVLEGMITSPVYQKAVQRTILLGPLMDHFDRPPSERLGADAEVLYSSLDGLDRGGIGGRLKPIEWAFDVAIVYGRRRFRTPGDGRSGEAEVLLLDVHRASRLRLDLFKRRLWERFGIDSRRYEHDWGYEEYVRLAEPGFHAALALLRPEELPAVLLAHEYMGLPTALKAVLDGQRQVRTIFHAHECSTARRLVEDHPGHDLRFYSLLRKARAEQRYVEEVFGDQSPWPRHALVSRAHLCDAVVAVGTMVAEELHLLDQRFDHHVIDLVHNGIPAWEVTPQEKRRSREAVDRWLLRCTGRAFDLLFTHVTRPVISKAIWRDLQVCSRLDSKLAAEGRSAILVILASAGGTRRSQDIRSMTAEYGWPCVHRAGYPDLVGQEVDIDAMVQEFNRGHKAITIRLVNQFGWSGALLGAEDLDHPVPMDMATLRAATDVEFGLACYEPFGISPLEPLAAGAICLVSNICGCRWFAEEVAESGTGGDPAPNVLVGDYIRWGGELADPMAPPGSALSEADLWSFDRLRAIGAAERTALELRTAEELAGRLHAALPRHEADRLALLRRGAALAKAMSWDEVLRQHLVPAIDRALH
jgi:hypothetical protein